MEDPEVMVVTEEMEETGLMVAWLRLVVLQEEAEMLWFRLKIRNYSC
jgi:hypothetical protein